MPESDEQNSLPTHDTRRSFLKQGVKGALLLTYVTPAVESVFLATAHADDDDDDGGGSSNSAPPSVLGNTPMPPKKKPNIDRVSPDTGSPGETITIYVWGHQFDSGASVDFESGVSVRNVSYESDILLTVEIEIASYASVGKQNVTVTNSNGESFTKNKAFEVLARNPPKINGLSPDSGVQGETVEVRIEGEDFQEGAQILTGTGLTVLSTVFIDATEIRVTIDISSNTSSGDRSVTVVNPDHQEDTKSDGFGIEAKKSQK
jgi:hypothetical protein